MINRTLVLALSTLAGLYGSFVSPTQDDELVAVLRRKAAERSLRPPQPDRVTFVDRESRVVPGLHYRWASYEVDEVDPPFRLYAVAVAGPTGSQVLRTGNDWGSAAAPWTPRTAQQAKQACVEMFQAVHADLGPEPTSYVPYEPGRTVLPRMQPENRQILLRKVRGGSQVRRYSGPARSESRVWVLAVAHNVSAYRVRCSFPLYGSAASALYSLTVTDSVIGPRNRLAI